MDKLEQIFAMQAKLNDVLRGDFMERNKTLPEQIHALATALIHESVEVDRTTLWKWWKKKQVFDPKETAKELIDAQHFIVAAWQYLGLAPEDMVTMYRDKHEVNLERAATGY